MKDREAISSNLQQSPAEGAERAKKIWAILEDLATRAKSAKEGFYFIQAQNPAYGNQVQTKLPYEAINFRAEAVDTETLRLTINAFFRYKRSQQDDYFYVDVKRGEEPEKIPFGNPNASWERQPDQGAVYDDVLDLLIEIYDKGGYLKREGQSEVMDAQGQVGKAVGQEVNKQ